MERCKTCKHWGEHRIGEPIDTRECLRITALDYGDESDLAERESSLAYISMDLDLPRLHTRPDFGCALHEPKGAE